MKDEIKYIELENKKYPIVFNLNVMEALQNHFESLDDWLNELDDPKKLPKISELKFVLLEMVNEGIDIENENKTLKEPMVTSKQLGRIISGIGIDKLNLLIKECVVDSIKLDEEPKNV